MHEIVLPFHPDELGPVADANEIVFVPTPGATLSIVIVDDHGNLLNMDATDKVLATFLLGKANAINMAPKLLQRALATIRAMQRRLNAIQAVVDQQAEDADLWSVAHPRPRIGEAYLQQELRRLHGAIEAGP